MNKKQNKGITLVALVITIIVLIILAGVSINAVMNGGLITNAKEAKNEYEDAKIQEEKNISQLEIDKVEMEFLTKGVPYKYKKKYLTGVNLGEKAVNVKAKLNKAGYELYSIDNELIQETDNTTIVSTGMKIKKGEEEIGEIVVFGDIRPGDGCNGSDINLISDLLVGFTENIKTESQIMAMDLNHDNVISVEDRELLNLLIVGEYIVNQNVYATDVDSLIIADKEYEREKFINELSDEFKKSQFDIVWSDEDKCYLLTGVEVGVTKVEDLLGNAETGKVALLQGNAVIKRGGTTELKLTDTLQVNDAICIPWGKTGSIDLAWI